MDASTLRRLASTVAAALAAYRRHASSQLAAAIAYRFLFSLVPFVALLASILDLVLPAAEREQLVAWLFEAAPGRELEESVERALARPNEAAPLVWVASLAVLLWAATGMMTTLRIAARIIWDVDADRPYVRGKLRDVALVGLAGALVVAAFLLSLVAQVAVEAGSDLTSVLGWNTEGWVAARVAQLASSFVVTFVALLLLYRLAPPVSLRAAELWPAALIGAVAFEVVAAGFGLYVAHLADFNAVYGPLGAVFAFLALVYVLAIVLLGGAELAAVRARAATARA